MLNGVLAQCGADKNSSRPFDGSRIPKWERQEERLSPLPMIGEGFREWFEAPSYEEGVGVDGGLQGIALQKMVYGPAL